MPTTVTKHAPGTFVWPELVTTDLEAGRKFYTTLFGWQTRETPMGPDQPPYVIFQLQGQPAGAAYSMMPEQRQQGVPPHWGAYVSVDDCDATVAKVKAGGGQVLLEPMDVMETLGRMAVCRDPQGAVFCLWQPKEHIGVGIHDEPGALCWTELATTDPEAAKKFYGAVIGWTTEAMPMPQGGEYTLFQRPGGGPAGGMMKITPEMGPVPPNWLTYFQSADIRATQKKAEELGAHTVVPPTMVPGTGEFAVLRDPQGAHFALLQPLPM